MENKVEIKNIGALSITSIMYISVIAKEERSRFTADEIAKKTGLSGKDLGGGWTTLTTSTLNRPQLLVKRGMFTKRGEDEKASGKGYYWGKNQDIDWVKLGKEVDEIVGVWGGINTILSDIKLKSKQE